MRLLREKWKSATDLAQELYAMFQDQNPVETGGGLTVGNSSGGNPLTITNNGETFSDQPAISFGGKQDSPAIKFGDLGGLNIVGPNLTLSFLDPLGNPDNYLFGQKVTGDPLPDKTTYVDLKKISKPGGGGGIPGKVISGTGATYKVDIYTEGLTLAPTPVTVKQLSIAADAKIPAGTWAVVNQLGDEYFMQVPVWLADPETT